MHSWAIWKIFATDEYFAWFLALAEPELGRPHADTLHGAKTKNLKELRTETAGHVLRVAFHFSKTRNGILLTGGDKKGKKKEKFYKDLIKDAEALIEKYKNYEWG